MLETNRDDSVTMNPFDGIALAYEPESARAERDADDDVEEAGNGGFLADL
jgi:hypothetical protein